MTDNRNQIKKLPMVGWLNPKELARTGLEVLLSNLFGKYADRRLTEAALHPLAEDEDFFYTLGEESSSEKDGDFWFDYVSDVGDGWDSTYSVAYYLAENELILKHQNQEHLTKKGKLLIFGGDEVYPSASPQAYQERLINPYQAAFYQDCRKAKKNNKPDSFVFAIPGNHDWYDSLVCFSDMFCQKGKFIGRQTLQDRSYFAVKLPKGWWLLATDMQLGSSLDRPQIEYFKKVMEKIKENPSDRIILCSAEPYWINSKINENDNGAIEAAMNYFQGGILDGRVALYLAGDLHHYRRHTNQVKGKHKIIAGGGGAFLHPTHGISVDEIGKDSNYHLTKSFPDKKESRKLCWGNLWFIFHNPAFGLITGFLYLAAALGFRSNLGGQNDFLRALLTVGGDFILHPLAVFWSLFIFGAAFYFTDKSINTSIRLLTALTHSAMHLIILFLGGWGISYWVGSGQGLDFTSVGQMLTAGVLIFSLGYLAGSSVMGIYLLLTMNSFGWNANEAFAALAIPDYKNFLRLKISSNGDLTVYPVGIKRVPRKWISPADTTTSSGQLFIPDDAKATFPELIEQPIIISKSGVIQSDQPEQRGSEPAFEPNYQVQVLQEAARETKIKDESQNSSDEYSEKIK